MKLITDKIKENVETTIRILIQDQITREKNGTKLYCNDPDYAQAIGIMQGLQYAGYGEMRSDNTPGTKSPYFFKQDIQNLKWWFRQIADDVRQRNEKGE
jgi:hypothetical protein